MNICSGCNTEKDDVVSLIVVLGEQEKQSRDYCSWCEGDLTQCASCGTFHDEAAANCSRWNMTRTSLMVHANRWTRVMDEMAQFFLCDGCVVEALAGTIDDCLASVMSDLEAKGEIMELLRTGKINAVEDIP